jgi:hypothetical protein
LDEGGLMVSPQDDDTVARASSTRRYRGETMARLGERVTGGGSTVEPEQQNPMVQTRRACARKLPADWAVATMRTQHRVEALAAPA